MRWLWRIILFCIVLLCMLFAAYAFSPSWVPGFVRAFLPANVELQELRLERASGTHLRVPLLTLRLRQHDSTRDADSFELRIDDAVVSYDWKSLEAGRLLTLSVAKAHITLPEHYAESDSSSTGQSLQQLLPSTWFGLLPFDELQLQELTVSRPGAAQFEKWIGSASLSEGLFNFRLKSLGEKAWNIAAKANSSNELSVAIEKGGEAVTSMKTVLQNSAASGAALVGSGEINVPALTSLLHELVLLAPELSAEGRLSSQWTLALPELIEQISADSVDLTGSLSGDLRVHHQDFGTLHCKHPDQSSAETLADYRWRGSQIDVSDIKVTCDGQLDPSLIPASLSRTGLKGKLHYDASFEQTASARFDTNTQEGALTVGGQGIPALSVVFSLLETGEQKNLHGRADIERMSYKAAADYQAVDAADASEPYDASSDFFVDITLASQLNVPALKLAPYSADGIEVELQADVKLYGQTAGFHLSPGAKISARQVSWLNGGTSTLSLTNKDTLSIRRGSGGVSVSDSKLIVTSQQVQAFGPSFIYEKLQLETKSIRVINEQDELSQFVGGLRFALTDLTASYEELSSHSMQLVVNMNSAGSLLSGTLNLKPADLDHAGAFQLGGSFRHDIRSNLGSASVETPFMEFNEENRFLPSLVQQWPYPLDFASGALKADASINWHRGDASSDFSVTFRDLGGFYQRNLFYGLNGKLHGHYENELFSARTKEVSIARLDTGLPFEDIRIDLMPELQARHIAQLSVGVMGGRANIKNLVLEPGKSDYSFNVRVRAVDLGQVLQTEGGVLGSGILDADLPLQITAKGIRMDHGRIKARAPGGVVQYQGNIPETALDANPQLGLAVDALRNFHYDVLDIDATYEENGKLTLESRLEGRNPESDSTRPVHFNLNVTEDIPALLKSLQLSQTISEKLEARIQQLAAPE